MTPPKKAAKKAEKKAAKHHPGHRHTSDLRRAYEHMSRDSPEILEALRCQGGNDLGDAGP
jgi:hypothetical protein